MTPEELNILILTISFLALIGVIALLFRSVLLVRKNKMIRKQQQEEQLFEKKRNLLESKVLRSQMNPHFVHNSLNSIQYYIQEKDVALAENYLEKFSKLIRRFFEYSRLQTITIGEEIALIENYLQIEQLRFEDKLNYNIAVDPLIDKEERVLPTMLLQPLVENAVNHGLFHKTEDGHISIAFKRVDDSTFQVIIEDNGIGINTSKKLHANSINNYKSKSSEVLFERIQLLNQTDNWNISYQAQDLSETRKTSGTLISLSISQSLVS